MVERSRFGLNRIICPTLDIKDFFQLANDLELQYVELRNDLPEKNIIDDYSVQEIRSLIRRYNVKICSINALQEFNYLAKIDKTKKELKDLVSLAREIDCQAIIMCPFNKVDISQQNQNLETYYQETILALKELLPLFQNNGLMGYIEPLGFATSSLRSTLSTMKLIKETGYEVYKIVHDTFHHFLGTDYLKLLGMQYDMECTGLMHISAVTTDISPEKYRDEHRNMDFKRDKLNNKEQVDLFVKEGYEGIISFEPFAKEVQRLKVRESKELIDKAIEYFG